MRNGRAAGYEFTSATAGTASHTVVDEPLDAAALVRRFIDASGAIARRLAVHLAAIPLTEPVMRLVRQEIVPEGREEHLVEVLFSGLVAQRIPDLWTAAAGEELFDFHPGVRELLLEGMSDAKVEAIARAIGAYLERTQGAAYNFAAMLDNSGKQGDATSRPFATVSAALVQTLHGASTPAAIDGSSTVRPATDASPPLAPDGDGASNITAFDSGAFGSGPFDPGAFNSGVFSTSEMASRARQMDQQAMQLFTQGEYEQGLAALRDVVSRARTLAKSNPDAFQPDLAARLNSLGINESALGHHELALAALRESVDLFRALVARNPDAFHDHLATSLHNLHKQLSAMGQHEQALAASREMVDIYRALAVRNPDAFQHDLATSLNNLANRLGELGEYQFAQATAHEAVELYRVLATRDPDAFQSDFAMSLSNLGTWLSELGQHEQALAITREAVDLYRMLSPHAPDKVLPLLATSLSHLGSRLGELGKHEEALVVSREAVDLCRVLAIRNPDTFQRRLAMALSNLGTRLSASGQLEESLATTRESVDLYRTLATREPSAQPEFATSLNNLGIRLSVLGQHEGAIAAAGEAVDLRRTLAARNPEAFRPDLAMTLNNLGSMLRTRGQLEEALELTHEAVYLHRMLAAKTPDAFQPDLAMSLHKLGNLLGELGRLEEAVAASREAVEMYRTLEARHPDAFRPALTSAVRDLNRLLALRTRAARAKVEPPSIDVLIIVALEAEIEGVLAEGGGAELWQQLPDQVFVRTIPNEVGDSLGVAVAWSGAMGVVAATARLAALVEQLEPSCLAMCGLCTGRRGSVALGDVIVADRIFSFDYGKLVTAQNSRQAPEFFVDFSTYNLERTWSLAATSFLRDLAWATHLFPSRPPTKQTQERWLLRALYAHEHEGGPAPLRHRERTAVFRTEVPGATDWVDRIHELRMMGLLVPDPSVLALSKAGRRQVEEDRLLHPEGAPSDPPFQVHVGPIASGSTAIRDPMIFERLRRIERKTLGIEMEASGIGLAGARWSLRTLVVKGVSDYADDDKDDRFREFACRASAACLLAFFKKHLAAKSPRSKASQRSLSLDNQSRSPRYTDALTDVLVSDQVTPEEESSNMDKLRAARATGKRVEILRHIGAASATLSVARANAQRASERNARGERVARILDAQGEREFECGVNSNEVQELLRLGAIEK
jgi:tetratricopeptide (TPR) repeat protein/nucleoside phosphorylase